MSNFLRMDFKNHSGEIIRFGLNNYYINESDVHDYEWDYEISRNSIDFSEEVIKKTIPVTIIGEKRHEYANKLFEVIDKDVREGIAGQLIVGEYRIDGYFYGQEASKYSNGKIIRINLVFISTSRWVKEELHNFRKELPETDFLDFDYDHDYDYKPEIDYSHIRNSDYVASDFDLKIYGPCTDPEITIGGHLYAVENIEVGEGEYVEINSLDKTITLVSATEVENVFFARNKDSYIFEKIPAGTSEVDYNELDFDLILYLKRGAPKWI